ncbi:MAG: Transglycosylase domain [Candidatus Parcubacteria bacterium]|jgi:hypothetical protein
MKPESKFRVVGQTEYGPIIERIPDDESIVAEGQEDDISEATEAEAVDQGRRKFLRYGFGAAGAAAATAVGIGLNSVREDLLALNQPIEFDSQTKNNHEREGIVGKKHQAPPRRATGRIEPEPKELRSAEVDRPFTASFEKELTGYKSFLALKKNQILLVDSENVPVGNPIEFRDFIDAKYHKDGRMIAPQYRFSPGRLNEIGVPETGIAKEWIEYVREQRQTEYPDRPIARCLHVVGDFNFAANNSKEPALRAAIADGRIDDYRGLIEYNARKPVSGAEDYTRFDYVQQAVRFRSTVPAEIQEELRRVIPGLCAQESKFMEGLTSRSGARGIFQFMPETWAHYGGLPDEVNSLPRQVEVAGEFFSDLYEQVQFHIGKEELATLRSHFSDEASFQRDLLVPLMVNSYNAGAARIGEGVRRYIAATPSEYIPEGKDLFLAIADFSKQAKHGRYLTAYGPEAREYVPRVYAQAAVLRA